MTHQLELPRGQRSLRQLAPSRALRLVLRWTTGAITSLADRAPETCSLLQRILSVPGRSPLVADDWHIPINRIMRIWREVETTWNGALLIAFTMDDEDAWGNLDSYQAILRNVEEWMVEQWEIALPGNVALRKIAARSRQDRASRRLLYEISVASDGSMKWWTVLEVPRNATRAEIRTAFHNLLKRYHRGTEKKPTATLIAEQASEIMTRAYEDANRAYRERERYEKRYAPTTRCVFHESAHRQTTDFI
jgi:hypothetical protein